ncbi:hypothetical protein [Mycolicibacterium sphagni]|nr:hypothetical protein [Mycolicibacterium sphagni]
MTGVALLGAGTVALAPIHPVGSAASPLSRIGVPTDVSTANVTLAAGHKPPERIASWVDFFTNAAMDAGLLGQVHLVDPPPVGRQALTTGAGNRSSNETAVKRAGEGPGADLATSLPHSSNTASVRVDAGSPAEAGDTLDNALGEALFAIALPLFPSLGLSGQIATNLSAALNSLAEVSDLINALSGVAARVEGLTHTIGDYVLTITAIRGKIPIAAALTTISAPTVVKNTGQLPRLSKDSTGSTDAANARPGATAGRAHSSSTAIVGTSRAGDLTDAKALPDSAATGSRVGATTEKAAGMAPTRSHSSAGQAGRESGHTGK